MPKEKVLVSARVEAPLARVWEAWTRPEHITRWTFASPDWHAPRATNDLRTGGSFSTRMEAKDGSFGFDFAGVYDVVEPMKRIAYHLGDEREVLVRFAERGGAVLVEEEFDPEGENSPERQREGWQAILDNFKRYVEGL